MSDASFFTVGGTVQAGGGQYVTRKVDDQLLDLCLKREFAFVLTARQMGKSSLMVRTAQRLAERGVASVIIDLSQIGVQVTPNEWYLGVLSTIEEALELDTDVFEWWDSHERVGHGQRLTKFFQEVVAVEIDTPVVMFVDEIDTTISLDFTDDFFAAIRYVYNARANVPEFEKISFVLIGVATPSDLISDPTRTPFNVGHRVDVEYFTLQEAAPLAVGFGLSEEEAAQLLKWSMGWTRGHPYLTQRLCSAVAEKIEERGALNESDVDGVVAETFFGEKSEQDSNLRFVHDMLTQRSQDVTKVLETYKRILSGKAVLDDRQSAIISHIKLSGVAGRQDGRLVVKNRIYERVFDARWISEQWPEHWIKRVPPAVLGLVAASFLALIFLGLAARQFERRGAAQEFAERMSGLNDQLQVQVERSDSLNVELSQEIEVSDSLRLAEQALNEQLVEQFVVTDSLRRIAEQSNILLTDQVAVSDSLRQVEAQANVQLSEQFEVSDSLRSVAEERFDAARIARLETITIALASKATRQLALGNAELGGLLARQAYVFSRSSGGEFLDPVYDALRQTLNALDPDAAGSFGGPRTVVEQGGGVRGVAYSPDGRWIASVAEDGSLGLSPASARDRTVTRVLPSHSAPGRSVSFSRDGSILATGGDDGRIRLWTGLGTDDMASKSLSVPRGGIWALEFEPAGDGLVSGGSDGRVLLWDVETGSSRTLSEGGRGRIRSVAFDANGDVLAAGTDQGHIIVWARDDSGQLQESTRYSDLPAVLSLAFSPSGQHMAAGLQDQTVRTYAISRASVAISETRVLEGHEGPVNTVAFGPTDNQLASGSSDHSAQLWNLADETSSPIVLQQHSSWVWSADFSRDGRRLVTAGADRTVRVWNTSPEEMAESLCGGALTRDLSPEEWKTFVGDDFDYAEDYEGCSPSAMQPRGASQNRAGE